MPAAGAGPSGYPRFRRRPPAPARPRGEEEGEVGVRDCIAGGLANRSWRALFIEEVNCLMSVETTRPLLLDHVADRRAYYFCNHPSGCGITNASGR